MLVKIKFGPLLLSIALLALVGAMMNGVVQEYVYFADPLNELLVTIILFCMMGMSFIASFEIVKQNKK
jgi:hypothetical protein